MFKKNSSCFVIAEAGLNHGGNFDTALKMIESAKQSGASAVKFQLFNSKDRFPGDDKTISLVSKCELSIDAFYKLKEFSDEIDIEFFATPFDIPSIDTLHQMGVNYLKIASCDISNIELLKAANSSGIKTIVSTGTASADEVKLAFSIFDRPHNVALLHCVSSYPLDPRYANLRAITNLKSLFPNTAIGYSDHSLGLQLALYARVLGAQIIEKHFTLDRSQKGIDYELSIEPHELKTLCAELISIDESLGDGAIICSEVEMPEREYRKLHREK